MLVRSKTRYVPTAVNMIVLQGEDGTYCRGKIVVDLREQPIEGRFVEHCLEVNSRKALNELFAAFQN